MAGRLLLVALVRGRSGESFSKVVGVSEGVGDVVVDSNGLTTGGGDCREDRGDESVESSRGHGC